ncbi:TPA: hypothetical protein DDY55_00505 [Candidatus Falkowbacteria bacterium]|nr:hypothetical protein [Candidatus Falkowbacteria bacterium]HBI96587.1 hypothetical protein [Candidatus Falkowbacteria bacterium]HBY15187.1 hypothetical protein [Candidatus Falkowbacteria bacterium]
MRKAHLVAGRSVACRCIFIYLFLYPQNLLLNFHHPDLLKNNILNFFHLFISFVGIEIVGGFVFFEKFLFNGFVVFKAVFYFLFV